MGIDQDMGRIYNDGIEDPMGNPVPDRRYVLRTNDWSTGQQSVSKPFTLNPTGIALGQNPKDLIGITKVSITKLPPIATVYGAMAMMDGAVKYGPYNWRQNKVIASIYVDAAYRHLMAWFEGQENASDSSVHHLGHVIACAGILLDAQATGNLVDDRPTVPSIPGHEGNWFTDLLEKLSAIIKSKKK